MNNNYIFQPFFDSQGADEGLFFEQQQTNVLRSTFASTDTQSSTLGAPIPSADGVSASCLADRCRLFGSKPGTLQRNPKAIHDAEKAITEELYEMSMKEREDVLHDIHGVSDVHPEEPNFVHSCLDELEQELQRPRYQATSSRSCEAYHMAMQQNMNYVRGMYLAFLRCEEFRVRDAAVRIIRHFDMKRDLFGIGSLGRDITLLDDFNVHDMECLKAGFYQLLPQRDRAGRAIFTKIWYHQTCHVRENVWRSLWYCYMAALQDEETQKRGMVAVIYNVDPKWIETFDPELFAGVGKLLKATPVRNAGVHYCFSDPAFGAIIKFISMTLDRNSRTRTRLHHGAHVEVQYELMSFGIPLSALPVNSDGVMRVKEHLKWIQNRKKYEMLLKQYGNQVAFCNKIVGIPSHSDVLFGRGKVFQMHLGNMKLSDMLEERGLEYFAAKRNEKSIIARSIVENMKKEGVRFLRQDNDASIDGLWVEVDDSVAIDKVGHGFRNRKPAKPTTPSTQKDKRTNVSSLPEEDQVPTKITSIATIPREYMATKRFRFDDKN